MAMQSHVRTVKKGGYDSIHEVQEGLTTQVPRIEQKKCFVLLSLSFQSP